MIQNFSSSNETNDICLLWKNPDIVANAGNIKDDDIIILYFVYFPLVLIIGIFGNSFSIAAMFKYFSKENIYYLQLLIMISDFIICIFYVPYCVVIPFLFTSHSGPNWVKRNFVITWFGVNLVSPLINSFLTCSIVLVAIASLDRLQVDSFILSIYKYLYTNTGL